MGSVLYDMGQYASGSTYVMEYRKNSAGLTLPLLNETTFHKPLPLPQGSLGTYSHLAFVSRIMNPWFSHCRWSLVTHGLPD